MTVELGHIALIIALCLAIVQTIVPLAGSYTGHRSWMQLGKSLAMGQLFYGIVIRLFSIGFFAR